MVDYGKKYQRIVDELIGKSFSELEGQTVKFFELKVTGLYGLYVPFFDKVGVNRLCRDFSKKEIIGILAHELCHAETARRDGFWRTLFLFVRYWIFPWVRKSEEDKIDKMAVRRGYVRELVLVAKRLEREFPDYADKTYMSSKKIVAYAKEVGKW